MSKVNGWSGMKCLSKRAVESVVIFPSISPPIKRNDKWQWNGSATEVSTFIVVDHRSNFRQNEISYSIPQTSIDIYLVPPFRSINCGENWYFYPVKATHKTGEKCKYPMALASVLLSSTHLHIARWGQVR